MPINNWNWYRAVGTGGDHKGWLSDNPQVFVLAILLCYKYNEYLFRLKMEETEETLVSKMETVDSLRMSASI